MLRQKSIAEPYSQRIELIIRFAGGTRMADFRSNSTPITGNASSIGPETRD